jgi:hypothetical protein
MAAAAILGPINPAAAKCTIARRQESALNRFCQITACVQGLWSMSTYQGRVAALRDNIRGLANHGATTSFAHRKLDCRKDRGIFDGVAHNGIVFVDGLPSPDPVRSGLWHQGCLVIAFDRG